MIFIYLLICLFVNLFVYFYWLKKQTQKNVNVREGDKKLYVFSIVKAKTTCVFFEQMHRGLAVSFLPCESQALESLSKEVEIFFTTVLGIFLGFDFLSKEILDGKRLEIALPELLFIIGLVNLTDFLDTKLKDLNVILV